MDPDNYSDKNWIAVRLDPSTTEMLSLLAEQLGISPHELASKLLRESLNDNLANQVQAMAPETLPAPRS